MILSYHRIVLYETYVQDHTPIRLNTVSVKRFEEQIKYLSEKYRAISMQDLPDCLLDNSNKKYVVITIDDGYKDTLEHALPVIEKYNVPLTVYLNTRCPDEHEEIWDLAIADIINTKHQLSFNFKENEYSWQLNSPDEKAACFRELSQLMRSSLQNITDIMSLLNSGEHEGTGPKYALTWDEIRTLDTNSLVTIGAHTHNHLSLAGLTADEAEYEMVHSRERLEEELGHSIEHFAYPFGGPNHVGEREFRLAKKCSFKTAVTVKNAGIFIEHKEHLHSLPRYSVSERNTVEGLKAKISGWEALVRHRGKLVVT